MTLIMKTIYDVDSKIGRLLMANMTEAKLSPESDGFPIQHIEFLWRHACDRADLAVGIALSRSSRKIDH